MPSRIPSHQYGQAVLDHVQTGAYPESEEVIAAELPPSALPEVSKLIQQAREDVKVTIKKLSKDSAPDTDGWISQAKQLRADIQNSQEISGEIVKQAHHGERLDEQVVDAASKVDLLNEELAFNTSLAATLERLQSLRQTLDLIQRALLDDRPLEAVDLFKGAQNELSSSSFSGTARIAAVLSSKITNLQVEVTESLTRHWKSYFHVDTAGRKIQIGRASDRSSAITIDSLVKAFSKLEIIHSVLLPFCKDFENLILVPRLQVQADGTVRTLSIDGDTISLSGRSSDLSAQLLFSDLNATIEFLRAQIPASVSEPLASLLMPHLISRLISTWLASAVPETLDGMGDFQDTLTLIDHFAKKLQSCGWPGRRELLEWMNGIPIVWFRKRQESSLYHVRWLLSKGLGSIEIVERVETQVLAHNDDVFAGNGGGDDWNARWSDDEGERSPVKPSHKNNAEFNDEEEDISAWGLDNEGEETHVSDRKSEAAADDDGEAWGWGDENEPDSPQKPSRLVKVSPKKSKSNGMPDASQHDERKVTLRETYNISSLPKEILQIINQVFSDAFLLETPPHASSSIAATEPLLLSLPGLILAMFRATASNTYTAHLSGSMYLYNDSIWLAEQLQQLPTHQQTPLGKEIAFRTANNLNLSPHITALETYGKRAYAKEMESQRTILTDLLDGAQSFAHCTAHPFNQECDIAIASTVDRLRSLHSEWKTVLSHSALLQSLGSLLSSITSKIIVDIEDMSDISEPESQQLATYCSRIATLEDLFTPETPEGAEQAVPLTAVYTPSWLKFQYLANILESSLVDIKYLWTEGELALEFQTDELIDLVLALFADSPHRRAAVGEIRAARR